MSALGVVIIRVFVEGSGSERRFVARIVARRDVEDEETLLCVARSVEDAADEVRRWMESIAAGDADGPN